MTVCITSVDLGQSTKQLLCSDPADSTHEGMTGWRLMLAHSWRSSANGWRQALGMTLL